jgi:hypothetical protein
MEPELRIVTPTATVHCSCGWLGPIQELNHGAEYVSTCENKCRSLRCPICQLPIGSAVDNEIWITEANVQILDNGVQTQKSN